MGAPGLLGSLKDAKITEEFPFNDVPDSVRLQLIAAGIRLVAIDGAFFAYSSIRSGNVEEIADLQQRGQSIPSYLFCPITSTGI